MNLSQNILGIEFKNPTILASGIWGMTAESLLKSAAGGAGALTAKTTWGKAHEGNAEPMIIESEHWTINAVGVPDPGKEEFLAELQGYMNQHPVPLIASIIGLTPKEFAHAAETVQSANVDMVEVNLSTPTFLKMRGKLFAEDENEVAEILQAVRNVIGDTPLFVKLTPNVVNIGAIAKAAVDAGADGISAINTLGPGMVIDLETRMPILSAHKGGLSGHAVKPVAVRCIAEIYEATNGEVPIIGMGGVFTGEDAVEMMLAGASLVGMGTAVSMKGEHVFTEVAEGIEKWCETHGIEDVSELVGGMHKELANRGIKGTKMTHTGK